MNRIKMGATQRSKNRHSLTNGFWLLQPIVVQMFSDEIRQPTSIATKKETPGSINRDVIKSTASKKVTVCHW